LDSKDSNCNSNGDRCFLYTRDTQSGRLPIQSGGQCYRGGVSADQVYLGEQIAIQYNPDNPEENNLASWKPKPLFASVVSIGIIDIMILWICFLIYNAKRTIEAKSET
jgi:hypothetical protein